MRYACILKIFYSEQYLPIRNCTNIFLNFLSSYLITLESKDRATAKDWTAIYKCTAKPFGFPIQIYYSIYYSKKSKQNHPNFWEVQEKVLFLVTTLSENKELEQMQTIFIW